MVSHSGKALSRKVLAPREELEEAQQLREMRADIVSQVQRRLASVRLPQR